MSIQVLTFNDVFPDYVSFQEKIETIALVDLNLQDWKPTILKTNLQAIYNQLNLAYCDRWLRYGPRVFVNHFLRIYTSTLPIFLTKIAGFDDTYWNNISNAQMRGEASQTTLSDENMTTNDNAMSNTPYNQTGASWNDSTDKVTSKTRDSSDHTRAFSSDNQVTDYISNLTKLGKPTLTFPLLNFVGEFNNLFVQFLTMGYGRSTMW